MGLEEQALAAAEQERGLDQEALDSVAVDPAADPHIPLFLMEEYQRQLLFQLQQCYRPQLLQYLHPIMVAEDAAVVEGQESAEDVVQDFVHVEDQAEDFADLQVAVAVLEDSAEHAVEDQESAVDAVQDFAHVVDQAEDVVHAAEEDLAQAELEQAAAESVQAWDQEASEEDVVLAVEEE